MMEGVLVMSTERYTITEVSKRYQISSNTLRYYEALVFCLISQGRPTAIATSLKVI